MLAMLTRILPAYWYCFDLMISLYLVRAYCVMPLASRHSAWLRATANDKSTLIMSARLAFYFNFRRFFSLLVASLAFSRASM